MGTANKDRQAKFKAEQRAAGRCQITVWADESQSSAIKAMLAGEPPAAAPQSQSALDDLTKREQALAEREQHVAHLEIFKKLNISEYDLLEKERRLIEQRRSLEQRRAEIEREEKALTKRGGEQMSFGERRKRLVEAHTTTVDWKTGEKRAIDTSWGSENNAKAMRELSRKTRIAASTITDVMRQFGKHDLLSEREKAALELGQFVLEQLAEAAGEAKATVSKHAKRMKEEEEARNRTAATWAKKTFDLTSPEHLIAATEWQRDRYDFGTMRDVITDGRFYRLDHIRESRMNTIASKIADLIKSGAAPNVAAQQVRAEFDAVLPTAIEKHADLIRDLNTALVAEKLEKANAKKRA